MEINSESSVFHIFLINPLPKRYMNIWKFPHLGWVCVCVHERQREKKKQTDLPNLQFVCLKKCFPSKVILRMECLPMCVFLNTHGEKWRLKKVIHTWQLYLLIFRSHKSPVTAKAFIPSTVQSQLIPYIMGESNRRDTPSAGTTECLLRMPSTLATKAQDKQMC